MSKSSDKGFVPKLPPNADMIFFAKDLVDYVMLHQCLNYVLEKDTIPFREYAYNAFNESIKRAVGFIANGINENNDVIIRKLKSGTAVCANFTKLAKSLTKRYFEESFDSKLFLFYCVRISRIASLYFNDGISYAPDVANFHIVGVLKKFHMIVGMWRTLHRTAEGLNNMQQVHDLISKYTDSEEICLLNRTQDEESVNKKKTSIINQNALLKEEENRVERQQERPHSEKVFLKKSDQFFAESSSEMDLSVFKKPEILKDLKRPMNLTEIERIYNGVTRPVYNKSMQHMYNKDTVYAATKIILGLCSSKIHQELIVILKALNREMGLRMNGTTNGNSQVIGLEVSVNHLLNEFNEYASEDRLISDSSNDFQKFDCMRTNVYKLTFDWNWLQEVTNYAY